jgi:hypothetical protein
MNRSRKAAKLHSVISHDNDSNVSLPAALTLSAAPSSIDNSSRVATTAWIRTYVGSQFADMVASAPATLDTLAELATALGNDPNFATTITTSIGTRVPQARILTINGVSFDLSADRSWTIAAGVSSFNTRTGAITLTSADVTTALGYTPVTNARTLTINGVTFDLSADRSFTVSGTDATKLPLAGGTMTGILAFSNVTGNKIDLYHSTTGSGDRYGLQVQSSELRIHSGAAGDASGGITFGKSTTTTFTEHLRIRNDSIVQAAGYLRTAGVTSNTVLFSAGASSVDFGNAFGQGTTNRSVYFRGNTGVSAWWGGVDGNGANIPFGAIDATTGEFTFWRNSGGTGGGAWTQIMTMNASGLLINSGDMRAPIFYDSNNTTYYLDPASTSNLVGLTVANTISGNISGNAATATTSLFVSSPDGDRIAGTKLPTTNPRQVRFDFAAANTVTGATGYYAGVMTYAPWDGTSASTGDSSYQLAFVNESGLNASGTPGLKLRNGINSTWNGWNTIFHSGNLDAPNKSGTSYYQTNTWLQLNGAYGLYAPSVNGAHWFPNTSSTYGDWANSGSRNGYDGIYSSFSGVNWTMYDGAGNGGVYREANGRWYWYYALGADCMGIGTSATSASYSLYLNKGVFAQSRIDATIFYDTNNTAYYVDPNNQSELKALRLSGGSTGSVFSELLIQRTQSGAATTVATGCNIEFVNTGSARAWILQSSNTLFKFFHFDGSTWQDRFRVLDNGGLANVSANNSNISDLRLKKDITPTSSYWDVFKNINIVKFRYKDQTDLKHHVGVIAQELEAIAPEFISTTQWDEDQGIKTVYTSDLHHATIAVLKEALIRIEQLETQLNEKPS